MNSDTRRSLIRRIAAPCFAATLLTLVAWADDPPTAGPYNLASLQGKYAIKVTIGAHLGSGLGVFVFDGNGNFSGNTILNLPGADNSRTVVQATATNGTYTVTPDGIGAITFTAATPAVTSTFHEDFVVTKASGEGTLKIAKELYTQRREPSVLAGAGQLVTTVFQRLPN